MNTPKSLILVAEDNPLIAEFVVKHLDNAGFATATARTGEEALMVAATLRPGLLVLDVMLSPEGMDGFDVCRTLRSDPVHADLPILMLTARTEDLDRITGFNAGVDDYLAKPFNPQELCARISAILRRTNGARRGLVSAGKLCIDPIGRTARANGMIIDLSPKEFDVLHLLASHAGRAVPRTMLLEHIWGYPQFAPDAKVPTRTLDVHIQRLRDKLAAQPTWHVTIKSEWGVGYKLVTR